MVDFIIYYFLVGLGINQAFTVLAQNKLKDKLGYTPSPDFKEIVLASFSWPLLLWGFINNPSNKEEED